MTDSWGLVLRCLYLEKDSSGGQIGEGDVEKDLRI